MSLSTQQKKKLTEFRKWVKIQRRRYRLKSYPSFSYALEERQNKLIICFSVNEVIGYDKKRDEALYRRKKKKIYLDVLLTDYKSINLRNHYNLVNNYVKKHEKKNQKEALSLPHWVEEYVSNPNRYGNVLSNRSLRSDKQALEKYVEWLKIEHPTHLDIYEHIINGKQILEDYLTHLRNTKTKKFNKYPSRNTINNSYRRIKGFFNWMSEKDSQFNFNMMKLKGFSQERNKDILPPATTENDMKVLFDWMEKNKNNKYEKHFIPILRMLLITGCRIGEVVSMRINDIDMDSRTWNFFGKTKRRTIKLDDETLWGEIQSLILDKNGKIRTDKEWVFHTEYWRKGMENGKGGGVKMNLSKHFSESGVGHKFKKVIIDLKLNPKLSPHSCRRGYITFMLEKTNGNVPMVASLVGHSSWEMVYRYNRERLPKDRTTIDLTELGKED